MAERLLTVDEVASMCRVHRKTISRAIQRGELRALRLGAYRMRGEDVDGWLATRAVKPVLPPHPTGAAPRAGAPSGRLSL